MSIYELPADLPAPVDDGASTDLLGLPAAVATSTRRRGR